MYSAQNVKVSVIIPTFNAEKYIQKTVESIAAQTYPVEEIIIVDDASQDGTVAIVEAIKLKTNISIHVICSETNSGASHTRNIGISKASGDWILFMDSDDIAAPTLLENEIKYLREINKAEENKWILVHTAYQLIDETDKLISKPLSFRQVASHEIRGCLFYRNPMITTSGVLVNRQALIGVGYFDTDLKTSEDWDLWIKLSLVGGFVYVDQPLIHVRRHKGNLSNQLILMQKSERIILQKYTLEEIRLAIYQRDMSIEENILDYVSILIKLDRWDEGLQILNEMLLTYPFSPLVHFYLGLYYIKDKQFPYAKQCFIRALELNPEDIASMNNLGVLYAHSNDMLKAEALFNNALEGSTEYLDARFNKNFCERHSSLRIDDAKVTWRRLRPVLLTYNSDE